MLRQVCSAMKKVISGFILGAALASGVTYYCVHQEPIDTSPYDELLTEHHETTLELKETNSSENALTLVNADLTKENQVLRSKVRILHTERDALKQAYAVLQREHTNLEDLFPFKIGELEKKLGMKSVEVRELTTARDAYRVSSAKFERLYDEKLLENHALQEKTKFANDWIKSTKEFQATKIHPVYTAGLAMTNHYIGYIRVLRNAEESSLGGLDFKYEKTVGKATRAQIAKYDQEIRILQNRREVFERALGMISAPSDK